MFSKSALGHVWTTIEFAIENAAGEIEIQKARFLIHPLTRKEFQARRREQMKKSSEIVKSPAEHIGEGIAADDAVSAEQIAQQTIDRLLAHIDRKLAADESDAALLVERTHDWRIKDAASNDVPFSREFLADLLEYDQFYVPYATRFSEICQGAVRKNSSPGPAGVQA